jgi:citrate lyase gamma subunit
VAKNKASLLNCQLKKLKNEGISSVLSQDHVSDIISHLQISFRERIFTPFLTLYAFVYQCLEDDSSCRRTVAHLMLMLNRSHKKELSPSTGSYCKARSRLPVKFLLLTAKKIYDLMDKLAKPEWQWKHGVVKIVDGTCISMADTKRNLVKFQKPNSKNKIHPDAGFPVGRIVAIFNFATGGVIDLAISSYRGKGTGELSLIHQLWHCFEKGDTLLGDSLYSAYPLVAVALSKQVHIVAEIRSSIVKQFSRKITDKVVSIKKGQRSDSLNSEDFDALPREIKVRIIKLNCAPAGFRVKTKWLLTTHLDAKIIPADDIALLYRQRWQAELNFRSIKTVLRLDFINAKTPEMVEKQIWAHMIVYNLIRMRIAEAGVVGDKLPINLSFRAAQQFILELLGKDRPGRDDLVLLYRFILANPVGQRPNRFEPRAIKSRKKNFAFLRESRHLAAQRLHKKFKEKKRA